MNCSRCGSPVPNPECFVCTEPMKTTQKPPRVRYFTDGEYYWKSSGAGVQVRKGTGSEWNKSCFSSRDALLKSGNLTEVSERKGEIA
jgi:hypothetical protein